MASNSNAETYDGCSDWEVEHVSAHEKATLEGMHLKFPGRSSTDKKIFF